jgi:hypothetical protein
VGVAVSSTDLTPGVTAGRVLVAVAAGVSVGADVAVATGVSVGSAVGIVSQYDGGFGRSQVEGLAFARWFASDPATTKTANSRAIRKAEDVVFPRMM